MHFARVTYDSIGTFIETDIAPPGYGIHNNMWYRFSCCQVEATTQYNILVVLSCMWQIFSTHITHCSNYIHKYFVCMFWSVLNILTHFRWLWIHFTIFSWKPLNMKLIMMLFCIVQCCLDMSMKLNGIRPIDMWVWKKANTNKGERKMKWKWHSLTLIYMKRIELTFHGAVPSCAGVLFALESFDNGLKQTNARTHTCSSRYVCRK